MAQFRSGITNRFVKGLVGDPASGYEDPTYLGFRLRFEFSPGTGDRNPNTFITDNPLFASPEQTGIDSAARYLLAIGLNGRAAAIMEFKEQLQKLIKVTPYYIQTVEGLADIWKIPLGGNGGDVFNNYRMANKFLAFETLESIDLRMTALADLYRKATFDQEFMRDILPENLKWFSLQLDIAEMRSFHTIQSALPALSGAQQNNIPYSNSGTSSQPATLTDLDNLISVISFKFDECVFDFNDAFPVRDAISMQYDPVPASSRFKIIPGRLKEKNQYSLLSYILTSEDRNIDTATGTPKYQSTSYPSTDQDAAMVQRVSQPYYNFTGTLNSLSGPGLGGIGGQALAAVAALGNQAIQQAQNVADSALGTVYTTIAEVNNIIPQFIGNVYDAASTKLNTLPGGTNLGNAYS